MIKKERVRILKPHASKVRSIKENPVEKHLVENLVHLQKVHTDLAEKFDKLSRQISELLVLFEMAARSFSKQQLSPVVTDRDKEFVDKIDKLLDQNKTIAKGLTLMEERIRERMGGSEQVQQQMVPMRRVQQIQSGQLPMPVQMPAQIQQIQSGQEAEELSIANKPDESGKPSPPVSRPLPRF